jgi:hypothetical protein
VTTVPTLNPQAIVALLKAATNECVTALTELFTQSGLDYVVSAGVYQDGQSLGHQGSNAVDLSGTAVQLRGLIAFARTIPAMFACVAYQNPDDLAASLFIWDGVIIDDLTTVTGATGFIAECATHIHVASSNERMLRALGSPQMKQLLNVDTVGGARPVYEPAPPQRRATIVGPPTMTGW